MLDTMRLEIRLIEAKDLEFARVLHNERSTLNMLTDPFHVSREEQLEWFNNLSKSRISRRYAIIEKESGTFCGIIRIDRIDMVNKNAEIGADISPDYRNRGYAFEAYTEVIQYLFHHLGLHRLQLLTRSNNSPAIALYKKLGFIEEGVLREALFRDNQYSNLILMSLLSADWKQNNPRD